MRRYLLTAAEHASRWWYEEKPRAGLKRNLGDGVYLIVKVLPAYGLDGWRLWVVPDWREVPAW